MNDATEKNLNNALIRLKRGSPKIVDEKRKISIKSLAEEAGISDASIHINYPKIADAVREIQGKELKAQRDKALRLLKAEQAKNRELRNNIAQLESDVRKLTSINASLEDENAQLKAEMASGKVVRISQN